jgi:hypothetical protein
VRGDALELPDYAAVFVTGNMFHKLIVCEDFFGLFFADITYKLDPGRVLMDVRLVIFDAFGDSGS